MGKDHTHTIELETAEQLTNKILTQIALILSNPEMNIIVRVAHHTVSISGGWQTRIRRNDGDENPTVHSQLRDFVLSLKTEIHPLINSVKNLPFETIFAFLSAPLHLTSEQVADLIAFYAKRVENTELDTDILLNTPGQELIRVLAQSNYKDYISAHPEELISFLYRHLKSSQVNLFKKFIELEVRLMEVNSLVDILVPMSLQSIMETMNRLLTKKQFIKILISYETAKNDLSADQAQSRTKLYLTLTPKSLINQFLTFENEIGSDSYRSFAGVIFNNVDPKTWTRIKESVRLN